MRYLTEARQGKARQSKARQGRLAALEVGQIGLAHENQARQDGFGLHNKGDGLQCEELVSLVYTIALICKEISRHTAHRRLWRLGSVLMRR
jgi:hypothetical protein